MKVMISDFHGFVKKALTVMTGCDNRKRQEKTRLRKDQEKQVA